MPPVRFTLEGAPLSGMISQVHLRVLESSFPVPTAMCTLTHIYPWNGKAGLEYP